MTENRVIGRDGDLPWRMSKDLRRFRRLTMGHHIVMGRKTYESIGHPLPGRTSVVISRSAHCYDPDVRVARSLEDAFAVASEDSEVFITGGATIFKLALPKIDRIYLTRIHIELEGGTFFPEVDWVQWRLFEKEHHKADEKNDYDYSFLTYQRKP